MSSVLNTKMSSNNQKVDDDGYASDATASIFDPDDSDGESMSGDELDEVENIARVIRPQHVSDESIYTPVSSSAATSSRKRNNNNKQNNSNNKGVLDYRTMTQQKARDEFIRATTGQEPVPPATLGKVLSEKNNQQQSQGPDVSKSAGGYKREIVPDAAKNAFARDKNPKPLMIDIGSITAQVENARQKKREADDEERKRLATLNNNNGYGFRSGADNNNNNNHANDESISRTQVELVASPKSMAPSELAKAIFIHNNNFHGTQEKANHNKNNNDDDDDDDSQELTVEENGDEEVAVGQEEELDDRQEYYQFLDAIVKTSKNDSERKTFRVPFSDESSTVAGKCAEIDWETREKGLRALNERNAKMHAAFARLGNSRDDTNSARRTTVTIPGHSQKSAASNNNNKSSGNGVTMGTSTADDEENGIIGSCSRLNSDLAFQQARALLEGMLLEDKFIDAVNNLLERAAPAFRYTKYTRMAGEFTLEQHRQWENYCQIIEHLILKKLHKIMDITDFFQRVFDEEDKMQKENDDNDDDDDDEEDEYDAQYSSTGNNVLTHDAWELLLSVMKFEAFCSLVDSYIESATELEMMSMVAPESKSSASSTTTTAAVAKANPVNASKAKPALFHALPRSGTKALGGGEDASSSSSGSNALINRQKMQAPRSAGSTPIVPKQGASSQVQQQLSTSSSISGRTPTTNNNNIPKVLGARNTTNK